MKRAGMVTRSFGGWFRVALVERDFPTPRAQTLTYRRPRKSGTNHCCPTVSCSRRFVSLTDTGGKHFLLVAEAFALFDLPAGDLECVANGRGDAPGGGGGAGRGQARKRAHERG